MVWTIRSCFLLYYSGENTLHSLAYMADLFFSLAARSWKEYSERIFSGCPYGATRKCGSALLARRHPPPLFRHPRQNGASCHAEKMMTTCLRVLLAVALLCTPMAALSLTGTQRRQLRAIAGRREAAKTLQRMKVVEPARSAAEVDTVLRAAELVRCKFPVLHKRDVPPLAEELAGLVDPPAEVAQVLGHTALLYRPAATPEIILET